MTERPILEPVPHVVEGLHALHGRHNAFDAGMLARSRQIAGLFE